MHSGLQATAQRRFLRQQPREDSRGSRKNYTILVLGTQEGLNRYLLNKQNTSRPTAVIGKDVKKEQEASRDLRRIRKNK